jgi:hypothetical protein
MQIGEEAHGGAAPGQVNEDILDLSSGPNYQLNVVAELMAAADTHCVEQKTHLAKPCLNS